VPSGEEDRAALAGDQPIQDQLGTRVRVVDRDVQDGLWVAHLVAVEEEVPPVVDVVVPAQLDPDGLDGPRIVAGVGIADPVLLEIAERERSGGVEAAEALLGREVEAVGAIVDAQGHAQPGVLGEVHREGVSRQIGEVHLDCLLLLGPDRSGVIDRDRDRQVADAPTLRLAELVVPGDLAVLEDDGAGGLRGPGTRGAEHEQGQREGREGEQGGAAGLGEMHGGHRGRRTSASP